MIKNKIKISKSDELKIIRSLSRDAIPAKQVHQSKKAYKRPSKHKLRDELN